MTKLWLSFRLYAKAETPRLCEILRETDRSVVAVARLLRAAAPAFLVACGGSSAKDITPPIVGDTTAPTVTATKPANGAVNAALNSTLSITFSEPLNAATLTPTTVTVVAAGGGAGATLAGSVTFSDTTATFTPAAPLAGLTKYTVTITTAVKDLAGNGLASDYVWSFTTAAPPDVTPPTVLSSTPVNDAVNVALAVVATVTMSEAMNVATLNASTILLTKAGDTAPVGGTVSVSGNTATFQPAAALTAGTKYTMIVTTGAKDLAGNALATAVSWSFTTVAPDPPTPSVTWRFDAGGWIAYSDSYGSTNVEASGQLLLRRSAVSFSALDFATGAVTWTISRPASAFGSAVFGSVFGINGSYVDPMTGAVLWSPTEGALAFFPGLLTIGETIVLQLPGDTILAAFERRTGREKWRARLGPLDCGDASFCGILRPIGADGATGYVLRTSSNEAQIITISETGIVREVVAASEVARRVIQPRQLAIVRGTTMLVAWTLYGTAAGIDAVTGAERWRSDFSTLGAGFFPNPTERTFYTPDGSLLFLQFDGLTETEAVLQVVLNTVSNTVVNRRVLSRSDYHLSWQSRCGDAGFSRLTPTGFEYLNMRTGARTDQAQPGLYDAMLADHAADMYPVGDGRVVFTNSNGNSPLNGMKCAP